VKTEHSRHHDTFILLFQEQGTAIRQLPERTRYVEFPPALSHRWLDDRKGIWLTNEHVSLLPKGCLLGQLKEGNQAGNWLIQIHLENGNYSEGGGASRMV